MAAFAPAYPTALHMRSASKPHATSCLLSCSQARQIKGLEATVEWVPKQAQGDQATVLEDCVQCLVKLMNDIAQTE